jgi:hypothetical protein
MGKEFVPVERIARAILVIRGEKVMLDSDLAALYGVTTGNLNKAVKRNAERLPIDFMFQLDAEEVANSKFQFGISSWGVDGCHTLSLNKASRYRVRNRA